VAKGTKPAKPLWAPSDYRSYDVECVQAVAEGRATEQMQKDAMAFIVKVVCQTYQNQFSPGPSSRETDYCLGKRAVGLELVKFISFTPGVIAALAKNEGKE